MAKHQQDETAAALWDYFQSVIGWVKSVFTEKRKEMKGLPWGVFYNEHGERKDLDSGELEEKIKKLMADEDVTRKAGIYEYLLTGNENALSIRSFIERDKRSAYEKQAHKCAICGKEFELKEMQGDHIIPWSKGGKTVPENCQMLCTECNIRKSNK